MQEFEAVLDEREVKEDAVAGETVAAVADDFGASYWVVAIESG